MKRQELTRKSSRRVAEYALVKLAPSAWAVAYKGICIPGAILRSRFAALVYAVELAVAAGHSSVRMMIAHSAPHALKSS